MKNNVLSWNPVYVIEEWLFDDIVNILVSFVDIVWNHSGLETKIANLHMDSALLDFMSYVL